MTKKLSSTDRKIVKLKVIGKNQTEIAKKVFPQQTLPAGKVSVTRALKKLTVQQALEQAFAHYNLTPDRLVKPISDALDATKTNDITGEVSNDHSTRLKAAKIGLDLMGAGKPQPTAPPGTPVSYTFINVVNDQKKKYGL